MFIDSEELIEQLRESAIKNLLSTLTSLATIWKTTTAPFKDKLPVLFIPVLFNGFKFDIGAISFEYQSPVILNNDGILSDECFMEIYKFISEHPKTMCYGIILEESENVYIVEFEDMKDTIKIKADIQGIEIERTKSERIPLLNFDFSSQ
jgi:hypothetical protein